MVDKINRLERGINELNKLDESNVARLKELLFDVSEDFYVHFIENFGDIFSRNCLDMKTRELVTIGIIATLGYAPERLKTHIKGALKFGASKEELIEVIMQVSSYAGFPAAVNGILMLKQVLK